MTSFFSRLTKSFAEVFDPSHASPCTASAPAENADEPTEEQAPDEKVVGTGASNETFIRINDVLHLFVAEEDGRVIEFVPGFESSVQPTSLGHKLLPELEPTWQEVTVHHCSVKEAIAAVIQQKRPATAKVKEERPKPASPTAKPDPVAQEPEKVAVARAEPDTSEAKGFEHRGRILRWGVEEIVRRTKKPDEDPTYPSFAIRIAVGSREKIVAGEGLKDALTDSGCTVGDRVGIKRVGKTKVPAFLPSGERKMVNGEPAYNEKQHWLIQRI